MNKEGQMADEVLAPKPKRKKQQSKWDRFQDAASAAHAALEVLMEVHQEYKDWYENMPDGLQASEKGERLCTLCNIDIEGALDTAQEALDAEQP